MISMKSLMRYCDRCPRYTFEDTCPACGGKTRMPLPPRFSPDDRYGRYRRKPKKDMRENKE